MACLAVIVLPTLGYGEAAEIHRCEQDDGTIAFQELPCAEHVDKIRTVDESTETPAETDAFFEFDNPFDAPAASAAPPQDVQQRNSPDVDACVQEKRNAIDAINLELRENPTKDDRETYLAELLALTRQLRACKS